MIAPNNGALEDRPPEVRDRRLVEEGRPERAERRVVDERRGDAAEDAEQQRVDVEQPGHQHERQEPRHHEVLDRVDAEHLQRVELLADLARAEVGGDRRAGDAGQHDRGHERRELADRGQHEEAAEAVDRAEEDEDVGRLQAWRAVPEGDGREQQREPAEADGEEELLDELAAVDVGRPHGGDERLAGQDHHVADLFQDALGRQIRPLAEAPDQLPSFPQPVGGRATLRARARRTISTTPSE
jgi:hypothetical protein